MSHAELQIMYFEYMYFRQHSVSYMYMYISLESCLVNWFELKIANKKSTEKDIDIEH